MPPERVDIPYASPTHTEFGPTEKVFLVLFLVGNLAGSFFGAVLLHWDFIELGYSGEHWGYLAVMFCGIPLCTVMSALVLGSIALGAHLWRLRSRGLALALIITSLLGLALGLAALLLPALT